MNAVEVEAVTKRFGRTTALSGVDLQVAEGEVVGLLGPNGAGKTTLVRVLATLLQPTGGSARIFDLDVTTHAAHVRHLIGLTGQYAAIDGLLTGRENLQMFGELLHLPLRTARQRAADLLTRFDLEEAADRPARTYSGGMRRRLDLASSLMVRPRLMFLDEPTTGLDPRSRNAIWDVTRELVDEGSTVLLTTQYLEEADQLADRIAVIDHGRIIAEGTGDDLKDRIGGQVVEVVLGDPDDEPAARRTLPEAEAASSSGVLRVAVNDGASLETVSAVADRLRREGITVRELGLRRPTLDDVFLELTGRGAAATEARSPEGGANGAAETEIRASDAGAPDAAAPGGVADGSAGATAGEVRDGDGTAQPGGQAGTDRRRGRAGTDHRGDRAGTDHRRERAGTDDRRERADTDHPGDRADTDHPGDRAGTGQRRDGQGAA